MFPFPLRHLMHTLTHLKRDFLVEESKSQDEGGIRTLSSCSYVCHPIGSQQGVHMCLHMERPHQEHSDSWGG